MATSPDFLLALAAMAAASYACRLGGFAAMRFVRATPRIEAALRAVPLSVMIGIVAPSLGTSGPAEWIVDVPGGRLRVIEHDSGEIDLIGPAVLTASGELPAGAVSSGGA